MQIDITEILRWWDVFHGDGKGNPVEIRILNKGKSKPLSGYFISVDNLIRHVNVSYGTNIYSCINPIIQSCSGRSQRDKILDNVSTTSDNDIAGRMWILVDIDPVRASDTNATDEEKKYAYSVMTAIETFLSVEGFSSPVKMDSGNGYHLYYRISLANTEENTALIKTFLAVLDLYFSTSKADVDTAVFNASRISKVPGTWSAKGSDTEDRPFRMCRFVSVPDVIRPTDIAYIQKVAALMPKPEKPSRFNGYRTETFNVDDFLCKHNIDVAKEMSYKNGGRKIILAHCPFDESHKAPDSAIFVMPDGAIGFKCLHNSCSQYTWRDVRLKFEPDAYEKRYSEELKHKEQYYSEKPKPQPQPVKETADKGKKWVQMSEVEYVDVTTLPYIPTGITEFDKIYCGLMLGDVTVMSGRAGCGKSSLINFITLNAIQRGYKVAVWSGELQPFRYQSWIDQCAAGRNVVKQNAKYGNIYYCPKDKADIINKWLDGKLFLYNNEYGNKWSQLFADIKNCVEQNKTQLVIVDNLAAMFIDSFSGDRNDRQSSYIAELKSFAKSANVHILQVIHPRKEVGNTLLRMESISGSGDLANLVDNVLLCHRVGMDFVRRATEFYGSTETDRLKDYNEVVEITKNRSIGIIDYKIGLYFELESRRFKNTKDEYLVYGWNENPQTITLDMYDSVEQESNNDALRSFNGYVNEPDDDEYPF